jgi:hypothetical protein
LYISCPICFKNSAESKEKFFSQNFFIFSHYVFHTELAKEISLFFRKFFTKNLKNNFKNSKIFISMAKKTQMSLAVEMN